jgi:hypothetical protein
VNFPRHHPSKILILFDSLSAYDKDMNIIWKRYDVRYDAMTQKNHHQKSFHKNSYACERNHSYIESFQTLMLSTHNKTKMKNHTLNIGVVKVQGKL